MMQTATEKIYTLEEYFAFCETHEGRFEYFKGEIVEKSWDSVTANQIAENIHLFLQRLLERQPSICVQSAVKLQVQEGKIFRIPDFLIFKETGNPAKYATEPLLIVEVLSETTTKFDRSAKLNEYRHIPSLQYYLIVDQESCFVEIYIREGKRWYVELYDKMEDIILLPYFAIGIPVMTIYKKIVFS